jgi:ferritin-like metal-binding protein YciE
MVLRFKDINEDFLENDINVTIDNFNNYAKTNYPNEITSIMMWLRMHKKHENDSIKVDLNTFLKETNLTIDRLNQLIKNKNKTVLINVNIDIDKNFITFSNLNKKVEEKSK